MSDLYSNFAFCRVTNDVASGDTVINVDDVSTLPTTAQVLASNFYMVFDSALTHPSTFEIVKVTAVGTTTVTVVRAQEGTTAVAHSASTIMRGTLTAGMLNRLSAGFIGSATASVARPQGTLQRRYTFDNDLQSWTTDFGTLTQTGGVAQISTTAESNILEPSSAANIADGETYIDFIPVTADPNGLFNMAIIFRATDVNNYYMITCRAGTNNAPLGEVSFYKKVAGSFTQINPGSSSGTSMVSPIILSGKSPLRVMVRFVASEISAYINESLVGTWTDSTYTTGRVGARIGGNGSPALVVKFDNVSVYSLASSWSLINYDQPNVSGLQAWQTATLVNSWTNDGTTGWPSSSYYLSPDGSVVVRGLIKGGSTNTVAFTLPTGYRPEFHQQFSCPYYDGATLNNQVTVRVQSDGIVVPQQTVTAAGANLDLSSIRFRQYG